MDELGKKVEAIDLFDKILTIEPNNITILLNKASSLCDLGYQQEEIDCYNQILEINPDNLEALCCKGIALKKMGNV